MTQPPVLEIRDLTVFRNRQRLISNVSFDVAPHAIHFLIGPNGAGKSTLFSAVLGLIEFSGVIRLNWCRSERIGYVPQFFTVDRTLPLTVGEFLALARQRRPVIAFGFVFPLLMLLVMGFFGWRGYQNAVTDTERLATELRTSPGRTGTA